MAEVYVFDCEADGLLDTVTKLHCLCYTKPGSDEVQTLTTYDEMREFLASAKTLIAHNCILYDVPVLERILGIKIKARIIDTLPLSWYLNHTRNIHGLESYGVDFGVPKPKIDNWENQTLEEYCHRCREDVKINDKLWQQLRRKLFDLYENKKAADRFLSYLMFKMECAALQQESQWRLNKVLAQTTLDELVSLREQKVEELKKFMPPVVKYAKRVKPAKPYKKDGTLSVTGVKWYALLRDKGLPKNYDGTIEEAVAEVEPNPGSNPQIKDWLFGLGWEPENFKFEKNHETGEERQIPQVRIDGDEGKELCPSVKKLIEVEPAIAVLEGLTVIQHRLSIFEGFLENERDGFLTAEVGGLTNTLRFKHRVLVNLPGVSKPYGEAIRGSLIARDGFELCGSDMSSLEDNTKRHFMWDYDPEYVTEMSRPGFDPHLDLAKFAGRVKEEDIDTYNALKKKSKSDPLSEVEYKRYSDLDNLRKGYKVTNYSATYGVQKYKLSRTSGLPVNEAQKLLDAFWERNWSLKKIAEDQIVKYVGKEMWLFNPVSKFWYSLRNEKDIFSTLNQGTGVFCFDSWIKAFFKRRKQLTGQFHDEVILEIKKGNRDACQKMLKDAIAEVNEKLQLNIKLDVDVQFGDTYADIH